jgi:hypothetical protein
MAFGDIIQTQSANAVSATSVTVNISAAVANNLLVCVHFTGHADSTAPSGFTEAVAVTDSGNNDQGAIYWKIAAGGETSVVPGSGGSDEHAACVLEIEGPWESSPVDQTATNGPTSESSTSSGTTGTTSQNDEVAVVGITTRFGGGPNPGLSGWTNSFVERDEEWSTYKELGTATKLLSSTGAVETTATHDLGSYVAMGMIATFKKGAAGADVEGTATVSGTGTISSTPSVELGGSATVSATATLSAIGTTAAAIHEGVATVSATGTLSASGLLGLNTQQEGYRWRDDDGNESGATWLQDQDAAASVAVETNIRLRVLVDAATGDPASTQYQLEYKKLPSGDWKKVKAEAGS